MADPFDDIRWKLRRAREHLHAADAISTEFLQSYIYSVKSKIQRDGRHTIRIAEAKPIPPMFGITLGEVAHQIRSALDHLMFVLARPTTTRELESVQFPIYATRQRFRRNARRLMPGVKRGVVSVVASFQPYHSATQPKTILLRQLQEIDNWSKHRKLPLTAVSVQSGTVLSITIDGNPVHIDAYKVYPGALKPDTVVARLRYADRSAYKRVVHMTAELTFIPVLDDSMPRVVSGIEVIRLLSNVGQFVENELLPAFRRFV